MIFLGKLPYGFLLQSNHSLIAWRLRLHVFREHSVYPEVAPQYVQALGQTPTWKNMRLSELDGEMPYFHSAWDSFLLFFKNRTGKHRNGKHPRSRNVTVDDEFSISIPAVNAPQ